MPARDDRLWVSVFTLVGPGAALLHYLVPFGEIGKHELAEFFRTAADRISALGKYALTHVGLLDDSHQLLVQPCEYRRRQFCRRGDAVPPQYVKSRQTGLGNGRNVLESRRALGRSDRNRTQLS